MGPQTVLADMAMPETELLPVLALASTSSFLSSATPPSDASFHDASLSSTPPTSVSPDNVSLASDQDAPTPKAIAVSCKTLDEPQGHPLLALALDAPDTTNAKLSLAQEGTVSLFLANKNLQQQQLTPQSEPQSENTPVFSGELDVEAQLERQLGRESELHVERSPAPGCDSSSVQQPTERAQDSTIEHGEREAIAKPTSAADDDPVPPYLAPEHEAAIVVATEPPAQTADSAINGRPRRARASLPTYNLSKLLGTDIHGRRASKGDDVKTYKRRRTVAGTALAGETVGAPALTEHVSKTASPQKDSGVVSGPSVDSKPSSPASKRAKRGRSESEQGEIQPRPEILTRRATRLSGAVVPSAVLLPIPSLPKRGKKAIEAGLSRCKRELLRLQDTKEFAHVDERPTITTVWSNGKFVDPRTLEQSEEGTRSSKRVKTSQAAKAEEEADTGKGEEPVVVNAVLEVPAPEPKKRTEKKWLSKGLYAGQEAPLDPSTCLTTQEKKKLVQVPELAKYSEKPNKTLPAPMFNGLRLLLNGRDFQLPYDICNPLPPGHPKPPSYRTLTKNRFVGEAAQYWKKQKHMDDLPSKCVCKPEDGCAEDCQNRIMLYECDDTNCNIGKDMCSNRPFATLTERTQRGGRFRVGVEVFKTEDRGFGVRSNRCFRPHEIIMEYTGEIITEDECLHRMDTVYKNNECYYLMSFASNIVIDATTGSIARFVNHSCSPNCRMIKWIVSGQPRMALFAGDRPIMTGEELTYDYNFAPYSKDPQKCLCGADNCRGVLGPKPRDVKVPKAVAAPKDEPIKKSTLKTAIKAGKRKLQDLLGREEDVYDDIEGASTKTNKKRKTGTATAASSLTKSSLQVAKGAAKALKRSVSSVSLSAKAALTSKASVSSLRETPSTVASKSDARKSAPAKATVSAMLPEKKAITSSRAAVAVALAAAGIAPSKKAANSVAKASGHGSGAKTIVAKAKSPKGLSTSNGNAKTKPKPTLKVKTTPTKKGKSPPKASKKHSGYTPPSSPKGGSAKQALFISSRKKTPTRKILESAKAGTASVTKPKATPQAKAKAKTKFVKKLSAIVKKQRDIASMLKAAGSETPSDASSSAAKKGKGKKVPGKASPADPSPVTAKSGIRAVAASPAGTKRRPRTPAGSNLDVVSSSPLSALSSAGSTPKLSPESPPESASRRAPRILLIRRDLTVDDSSN